MTSRILLVENDSALAQELEHTLSSAGFETVTASSGKQALDLAFSSSPQAIVLNVELPDTSGYLVCQKLRKDEALRSIPLVLTSAEATDKSFSDHQKLKVRADEYLKKPYLPAQLVEALSRLVGLPSPFEEAAKGGDSEPSAGEGELPTLDLTSFVEETADTGGDPASKNEDVGQAPDDDDAFFLDAFREFSDESGGAEAPPVEAGAPPAAESGSLDPFLPGQPEAFDAPREPAQALDLERSESQDEGARATPISADTDDTDELFLSLTSFGEEDEKNGAVERASEAKDKSPRDEAQKETLPGPLDEETGSVGASASRLPGEASRMAYTQTFSEFANLPPAPLEEAPLEEAPPEEAPLEGARKAFGSGEATGEETTALAPLETDGEDGERERLVRELADIHSDLADARGELLARDLEFRTLREKLATTTRRAEQAEAEVRDARDKASETAELLERLAAAEGRAEEAARARAEAERRAAEAERKAAQTGERVAAASEQVKARAEAEAFATERANALQTEVDKLNALLASATAQMKERKSPPVETTSPPIAERLKELEATNAKNEERVLRAFQKIRSDEKVREKVRKALAIASQLLDEGMSTEPAGTDRPRPAPGEIHKG